MRTICLACGKETIKAGPTGMVSHGCCEGRCEEIWNDWLDKPSPKPTLRLYYLERIAPNVDRAQVEKLGGS